MCENRREVKMSLQAAPAERKIGEVRISQRLFVNERDRRGNTRWIIIAAISSLLLVVVLVAFEMRPSAQISKRQASLIEGIERRSPPRIQRLLAKDYGDRWGFTSEQIVESMVDAGSQFMALVVTPVNQSVVFGEGGEATVSARVILSGKPVGPVGNEVTRQINQLKEPFVFVWKKQSFLPSSWRLVRVDNAALPDDLYGYDPGDIRRAMQGE
jgi:hypothetical protein